MGILVDRSVRRPHDSIPLSPFAADPYAFAWSSAGCPRHGPPRHFPGFHWHRRLVQRCRVPGRIAGLGPAPGRRPRHLAPLALDQRRRCDRQRHRRCCLEQPHAWQPARLHPGLGRRRGHRRVLQRCVRRLRPTCPPPISSSIARRLTPFSLLQTSPSSRPFRSTRSCARVLSWPTSQSLVGTAASNAAADPFFTSSPLTRKTVYPLWAAALGLSFIPIIAACFQTNYQLGSAQNMYDGKDSAGEPTGEHLKENQPPQSKLQRALSFWDR